LTSHNAPPTSHNVAPTSHNVAPTSHNAAMTAPGAATSELERERQSDREVVRALQQSLRERAAS
jgi:hypothetical protein